MLERMYATADRFFNLDSRLFAKRYAKSLFTIGVLALALAVFLFLAWLSGDFAYAHRAEAVCLAAGALGTLLALGCACVCCRILCLETEGGFGFTRERYRARYYGRWDCDMKRPKQAMA